jgi:hypothetical protein
MGPPSGLKALPPRAPAQPPPSADENPFTLPSAPKSEPEAAPAPQPGLPPVKKSAATPPLSAPTAGSEGFTARLLRSFRSGAPGQPPGAAPEPAPKPAPVEPPPPEKEPEQKGFSLPDARPGAPVKEPVEPAALEEKPTPAPVEKKRETLPPVKPKPAEKTEAQAAATPPPVSGEEDDGTGPLDLDSETASAPAAATAAAAPEAEAAAAPIDDMASGSAADALLPATARTYVAPGYVRPQQETAPDAPSGSRNSLVVIAAVAGAALGTVSVLAVYLLMRSDTTSGAIPASSSPFGRPVAAPTAAPAAAPAPVAVAVSTAALPQSPQPLLEAPTAPETQTAAPKPAPVEPPAPSHPGATFAATPKLVVNGQPPAPKLAPLAEEAPVQKPRKPKGPSWVFQGMVFDLITTRGVFAAKLVWVDANGDVVGETETGPGGRYKISLPAGTGYKLKITHGDYADRYIDEGDTTSSLRDATPEERRILVQAAARTVPWIGEVKKPTTRDLALVPRSPEEP